jgi:hypothetical protein
MRSSGVNPRTMARQKNGSNQSQYTPFTKFRLSARSRLDHRITARSRPLRAKSDSDEDLVDQASLTLHPLGGGSHQDPFASLPAEFIIPDVGNALDFRT